MDAAVRCTDLVKRFENTPAVYGLSFEVQPGEVFGLVGPDGAGKTTTIRMMCGIIEPTSGSIEVLGAHIPAQINQISSQIGYMSQRFSLYGDLTVMENINFFADLHQVSTAERRERAERLLHASRMEAFTKRLAENLSGGMKQKLALICTLVHTPKILFLDEPTTGVDPISRREFWQILYGLVADGMTLIVSTPYMDEADRCQRLGFMNKGQMLVCETPAKVRAQMDRAVVEIFANDPQQVRKMLLTTPGVISVENFGQRLHATLENALEFKALQEFVRQSGAEMNLIQPTLEDAFITLLEEGEPYARV